MMVFMGLFAERFPQKELPENNQTESFYGEVYSIEYKNEKYIFYLKNKNDNYKVICYSASSDMNTGFFNSTNDSSNQISQIKRKKTNIQIGSKVMVTGKVRHFERAVNDGMFDEKQYYQILGIDYALHNCSFKLCEKPWFPLLQWIYNIKWKLEEQLEKGMNLEDAGIMKAMLFGDKKGLDEEVKDLYTRNGIAHIIAISGLHITMWGLAVCKLLRHLKVPLVISNMTAFLFVVFYGYMTGSQASAIRSVIMFALYLLAQLCQRTYDLMTAMGVSAVILLCINPRYVFQCGFLLSFAAIFGIAFLQPLLKQSFLSISLTKRMILEELNLIKKIQKTLIEYAENAILLSVSISLLSIPIQIRFFYTFSPFSAFLNMLIVPFVGMLLFLGMVGVVVHCIFPIIGRLCFLPCHFILLFYKKICILFDPLPFAHPVIRKPSIFKMVIYYVILVILMVILYESIEKGFIRKIKNIICVLLLINICVLCLYLRMDTTLTMLDVGQGDCFVIEEKSGKNILVDGGSSSVKEVGNYRIDPYLKSRGIAVLDYVFLSHIDEDHVNGVRELLDNSKKKHTRIGCLVLTEYAKESELYHTIIELAEQNSIPVKYVKAGDHWHFPDMELYCLMPTASYETGQTMEENDRSMILYGVCHEKRFLMMGDLTTEGEKRLLEFCNEKSFSPGADILKVGHHGSKYSSSKDFLHQVHPKLCLVSAGENNSYGHPHREVLERIREEKGKYLVTAERGMVRIVFRNRYFEVFTPYFF